MESKGEPLMAEAAKIANASSFGSIFGFGPSKSQKYEDAGATYVKAGNAFKVANSLEKAASAFLKAAESFKIADASGSDIVNNIVEAANCYKKVPNNEQAIQVFQQAIEIYNEGGRFGMSAKYAKEIAEICEAEGNSAMSLEYYEMAAQSYIHDNKPSQVTACKLKIGIMRSEMGEYTKAAGIFDEVAKQSLENKLSAFSAKGYMLQCLLCLLAAGDPVAVSNRIEEFKNKDFSFSSSRECSFMEKLLVSFQASDPEEYATACAEFDRVTPLDPWKTTMLLKGKEHIEEKEPDLS